MVIICKMGNFHPDFKAHGTFPGLISDTQRTRAHTNKQFNSKIYDYIGAGEESVCLQQYS